MSGVRLLAWVALLLLVPTIAQAQLPPPGTVSQFDAAGHKPLSGDKLVQMLVGNTAYTVLLQDWQGAPAGAVTPSFFRSAGRATLGLNDGRSRTNATWWTESDRMCMKYKVITEMVGCSRFYDVGDVIYVCRYPTGECVWMLRVAAGNPEKL